MTTKQKVLLNILPKETNEEDQDLINHENVENQVIRNSPENVLNDKTQNDPSPNANNNEQVINNENEVQNRMEEDNEHLNEHLNDQLNQQINEQLNDQLNDQLNQQVNEQNQMNEQVNFYNGYSNNGINMIDPTVYSPMIYVVNDNKMIYSNNYPFIYDPDNRIKKNTSLPYAYVSRNSFIRPDFNIVQNKLKLYNYWIETNNSRYVESKLIDMFGLENIYITKSLFFRKKNSYRGEKVILINKLPQKPYKFINRINRTFSTDRRTIKSVLGDYIISPDCLFIILAEKSVDYICNNYYRYHKNERIKIEILLNSFKQKFTCINENEFMSDNSNGNNNANNTNNSNNENVNNEQNQFNQQYNQFYNYDNYQGYYENYNENNDSYQQYNKDFQK